MKIQKINSPIIPFLKGDENRQAFTLVELIVVITILAILWTIAFISLQWFSKDARNSTRASDLKNIEKVLSLYQLRESEFPLPSYDVEITYSWSEVWTQWTFWEDTRKQLGNQWQISNVPTDPLTWSEYTYSRLNTKNEFQLAAVFEWDLSNNNLLNETYAAWIYWTTKITWNYNGQVAKTTTWSITYVLAVPSIISWDISLKDIIDILNAKELIYNWFHNLPASYSWTTSFDNPDITWDIINTWSLVVYSSWSLDWLSEEWDWTFWDILWTSTEWTDLQIALKLPMAGLHKWYDGDMGHEGSTGMYRSASPNDDNGYYFEIIPNSIYTSSSYDRANWYPVRCFKN